jgi:hypothetical protein
MVTKEDTPILYGSYHNFLAHLLKNPICRSSSIQCDVRCWCTDFTAGLHAGVVLPMIQRQLRQTSPAFSPRANDPVRPKAVADRPAPELRRRLDRLVHSISFPLWTPRRRARRGANARRPTSTPPDRPPSARAISPRARPGRGASVPARAYKWRGVSGRTRARCGWLIARTRAPAPAAPSRPTTCGCSLARSIAGRPGARAGRGRRRPPDPSTATVPTTTSIDRRRPPTRSTPPRPVMLRPPARPSPVPPGRHPAGDWLIDAGEH